MEAKELKQQLAETIRSYHQKGWSPATSTNYSFRTTDNPDCIYVSRSGVDKSQFSENDFISVDFSGNPLPEFAGIKPSAETLIHCSLYELFPDTMCILHSHSVYSVLHSAIEERVVNFSGYEVLKGYAGIETHETSVDLPIYDNTQHMVDFSEELFASKTRLEVPAFIMRKHGTYAWGKNLFEAKRHLETTEYLLEVEWKLKQSQK